MVESGTSRGKHVDIGGLVILMVPIAFVADIVGYDDNDVGLAVRAGGNLRGFSEEA